jgi:hypothetical protein
MRWENNYEMDCEEIGSVDVKWLRIDVGFHTTLHSDNTHSIQD